MSISDRDDVTGVGRGLAMLLTWPSFTRESRRRVTRLKETMFESLKLSDSAPYRQRYRNAEIGNLHP